MSTTETTTEPTAAKFSPDDNADIRDYHKRAAKKRARQNRISQWHLELYIASEGLIELPHDDNETYVLCTVSHWNPETRKSDIDEKATIAKLSAVTKFALSQGAKVEKKYDHDFSLQLELTEPDPIDTDRDLSISFNYYADREAVCTKKVVGHKVVPATSSPARVEEVIEWDCNPVSLLAGS